MSNFTEMSWERIVLRNEINNLKKVNDERIKEIEEMRT